MLEDIKHYIEHSIDVKVAILNNERLLMKIYQAAQLVISSIRRKGKILIAGNGGSAADSMHMATEFAAKFYAARQPLPAIALCADPCVMSAVANDFSFEYVYSRQIEAMGRENDVFIAISTSVSRCSNFKDGTKLPFIQRHCGNVCAFYSTKCGTLSKRDVYGK